MQNKSNINWQKLLQGVALTAAIVAPFFGATPISQAAPPDYAPAYGYRNRDHHNDRDRRDRDVRNRRDRDNRHDRNNDNFYNSTRSLEGVVVNDLRGRDFILRANNGRNIRVQLDDREPERLSQGDRVVVYGSFNQTNRNDRNNTRYNDNLVFRASSIRILSDRNNNNNRNNNRNNNNRNNNNYNGRRTLSGMVTDVRSDRRFTLNALNRTFEVTSASRLPRGFTESDFVRVSGDVRGDSISNASVTILNNGNANGNYRGGYNGSFNASVNFPATVIDSNQRNNTLLVRGEDGRQYTVRTNEADDWKRGDRVRIKGRTQNGVVIASDIDER